jgi:hypothetical protein
MTGAAIGGLSPAYARDVDFLTGFANVLAEAVGTSKRTGVLRQRRANDWWRRRAGFLKKRRPCPKKFNIEFTIIFSLSMAC